MFDSNAIKAIARKGRIGARSRARAFHKDENGVLVAFGAFFILMIVIMGGIGIDLMRFEMRRTGLQGTLDRAVLAAADLDQQLTPQQVVNDYFNKSGMSSYLTSVQVDQGLNYKSVSATANMSVPTQFIHMLGINNLNAPAAGTAQERIDQLEISLVLDISGSMGRNGRMSNLHTAGQQFIDTMFDNTQGSDLTISIVPYATQVNAGSGILSRMSVSNEHTYSHCIDFEASHFNTTQISTGGGFGTHLYQRTGHFDKFYYAEGSLIMPVCPVSSHSEIMPLSMNRNALKNRIASLQPDGNTSIDIGMKWGVALLDPSLRSVVTGLIGAGTVDNAASGRPYDYTEPTTMKIVVLMTDGQNTSQYYLNSNYRSGNSDVWYSNNNGGRYSRRSGSRYYIYNTSGRYQGQRSSPWPGSTRLTYPQLFNRASLAWIARYLYGNWNTWYHTGTNSTNNAVNGSTKNTRLDQICTQAKNAGIIVYTIGFEAPSSGQTVLRNCASSSGHYFDVNGVEISEAFQAIASSITSLRLTQ